VGNSDDVQKPVEPVEPVEPVMDDESGNKHAGPIKTGGAGNPQLTKASDKRRGAAQDNVHGAMKLVEHKVVAGDKAKGQRVVKDDQRGTEKSDQQHQERLVVEIPKEEPVRGSTKKYGYQWRQASTASSGNKSTSLPHETVYEEVSAVTDGKKKSTALYKKTVWRDEGARALMQCTINVWRRTVGQDAQTAVKHTEGSRGPETSLSRTVSRTVAKAVAGDAEEMMIVEYAKATVPTKVAAGTDESQDVLLETAQNRDMEAVTYHANRRTLLYETTGVTVVPDRTAHKRHVLHARRAGTANSLKDVLSETVQMEGVKVVLSETVQMKGVKVANDHAMTGKPLNETVVPKGVSVRTEYTEGSVSNKDGFHVKQEGVRSATMAPTSNVAVKTDHAERDVLLIETVHENAVPVSAEYARSELSRKAAIVSNVKVERRLDRSTTTRSRSFQDRTQKAHTMAVDGASVRGVTGDSKNTLTDCGITLFSKELVRTDMFEQKPTKVDDDDAAKATNSRFKVNRDHHGLVDTRWHSDAPVDSGRKATISMRDMLPKIVAKVVRIQKQPGRDVDGPAAFNMFSDKGESRKPVGDHMIRSSPDYCTSQNAEQGVKRRGAKQVRPSREADIHGDVPQQKGGVVLKKESVNHWNSTISCSPKSVAYDRTGCIEQTSRHESRCGPVLAVSTPMTVYSMCPEGTQDGATMAHKDKGPVKSEKESQTWIKKVDIVKLIMIMIIGGGTESRSAPVMESLLNSF